MRVRKNARVSPKKGAEAAVCVSRALARAEAVECAAEAPFVRAWVAAVHEAARSSAFGNKREKEL